VDDLSAITTFVPAGLAAPDTHTAGPYRGGPRVAALRPGDPALAQLRMGAAALRRFAAQRPWLVAQTRLTGATPRQVVAVLGWEPDELRFAIGGWVPELRKQGQLTDGQGAALLARVSGGAG